MEKTSQIEITIIVSSIIIVVLCTFAFLFVLLFIKKKQKLLNENFEIKTSFEQALLRAEIEIREHTLKSISQAIHDDIGQRLTLAKLGINKLLLTNILDREKAEDAVQNMSWAIQDLRDLSKGLNKDSILEMGFVVAIENELTVVEKSSITTFLQIDGTVCEGSKEKELILFRIIQECLHNIIKHANATHVQMQLLYKETMLLITIEDNGKGFDILSKKKGQGLTNLKSRAALLHATYEIKSVIDKGTKIEINFPTT